MTNMKIEKDNGKHVKGYKHLRPMNKKEIKAHLYAPCPVCGILNKPYNWNDRLFGIRTYHYRCNKGCKYHDINNEAIYNIDCCGTAWKVNVKPEKMFVKGNLCLTYEEVLYLTQLLTLPDPKTNFIIKEKQQSFWYRYYNERDKMTVKKLYLKFLHWVVDICRR